MAVPLPREREVTRFAIRREIPQDLGEVLDADFPQGIGREFEQRASCVAGNGKFAGSVRREYDGVVLMGKAESGNLSFKSGHRVFV